MSRFIVVVFMTWFVAANVHAAEWRPDKRVEVIVPNAAGGGNDRIARLMQKITQEHKLIDVATSVVNKPGAGVVMGLNYLNQFAGDGHHVAIVSSTFMGDYVSGRSTMGLNDVTPIAQLFTEYVAFAVKPDSSLTSARDVLTRLKADVTSVSTAFSGGAGNHNHLALAMVARAAGGDPKRVKIVIYSSGSDALTAALGGHVDMVVAPAATVLPQVQSGRLRFLALAAPRRLPGPFAAVPVWKELGANAVTSNWRAVVGPRGLAADRAAYWEGVLARVVESDDWKKMLKRDSVTPEFLRGARLREALKVDAEELRAVMSELGLVKQ